MHRMWLMRESQLFEITSRDPHFASHTSTRDRCSRAPKASAAGLQATRDPAWLSSPCPCRRPLAAYGSKGGGSHMRVNLAGEIWRNTQVPALPCALNPVQCHPDSWLNVSKSEASPTTLYQRVLAASRAPHAPKTNLVTSSHHQQPAAPGEHCLLVRVVASAQVDVRQGAVLAVFGHQAGRAAYANDRQMHLLGYHFCFLPLMTHAMALGRYKTRRPNTCRSFIVGADLQKVLSKYGCWKLTLCTRQARRLCLGGAGRA